LGLRGKGREVRVERGESEGKDSIGEALASLFCFDGFGQLLGKKIEWDGGGGILMIL
jgi:hypothetical protein